MIYGVYKVKTLVDEDKKVGRLIVGPHIIKVSRGDKGWVFQKFTTVADSENAINPTWKTNKEEDKLPDLTPKEEADIFDAMTEAIERANVDFGIGGAR
jgi:hypothetical protein